MTSRRRRSDSGVRVGGIEALEGRAVLSAVGHPLHAAAVAHPAAAHVGKAHAAATPAASSPVLVVLTPDTAGVTITDVRYDPRIHLITVKGVAAIGSPATNPYYGYTPTYPLSAYVGISATQSISRTQSVSGFQYTTEPVADASVTSVRFVGKLVATAGEFRSGLVTLTVSTSNPYYYSYNPYSVIARMHNANAY